MKTLIYIGFVILFCMLCAACSKQTVVTASGKKIKHRYTQFDSKSANRNMVRNTQLSSSGIPVKSH